MAYTIDQAQCAGCGVCESSCPSSAIVKDGDKYTIEADKCTDCGSCVDACPMSCIAPAK